MGHKYNTNAGNANSNLLYDDNAFQVFLLSLLLVYWVPSVFLRVLRIFFRRLKKVTALDEAKAGVCGCRQCMHQKEAKDLSTKNAIPIWDVIFVLATASLGVVAYRVYHTSLTQEAPFDPFEILGVDTAATTRQIRKAYRKLSVLHHPDKNLGDPTAGERFIRLSKAFSALTDEEAKRNYVKYGNPDGYIGTTLGLGLPEWVATRQNTVLFIYVMCMVVFFPVAVGIWWHRRNKQMTDVVMTDTYMLYRDTLQQSHKFRDMLAAFASSFEFESLHVPEHQDKVQDLINALKRAGKMDLRKMNFVMQPTQAQVQNIVILSARIAGVPIPPELQPTLDKILQHSEPLLTALADTVGVFQRPDAEAAWNVMKPRGHTVHLITCLRLMQCVFRGTDEKDVALLQLPHFTEKEVKFCTTSRTSPARDIYNFMRLQHTEQRSLLRGFTDEQFDDVMKFCERYPFATLTASTPAVEEEEDNSVYEGDTVTIRAKLTVMRKQGSVFSPCAPDLPHGKNEIWWVWLADARLLCPVELKRLLPTDARGHNPDGRKIDSGGDACCGPISACGSGNSGDGGESMEGDTENKKNEGEEELAKDMRVTIYDMKFNFVAPRAGEYTLELQAAVDCYHGCSKKVVLAMTVKEESCKPTPKDLPKYFDTDDESVESDSDESSESDYSDDENDGANRQNGGEGNSNSNSDSDEYEYIEVTDSEQEDEDDDMDDDIVDITGPTDNVTEKTKKNN